MSLQLAWGGQTSRLVNLARAARVSIEWLATGQNAPKGEAQKESGEYVYLPRNSVRIPVGRTTVQSRQIVDYLALVGRVGREVYRTLQPGGRYVINIANLGRKPYIPIHSYMLRAMLEVGFLMRGEVIWDKGASAAASTSSTSTGACRPWMGSWRMRWP